MRFPSLTPDVDLDYLFKAKKCNVSWEIPWGRGTAASKPQIFACFLKHFEAVRMAEM